MQTLTINQKPVLLKEYKGQRVVTLKDIDLVHERPNGTARKRFNDNQKHFLEETDYFKVKCGEVRPFFGRTPPNGFNPNADIILITESGYLMLVKSFTDDLAWEVQRELVNTYFRSNAERRIANNAPATSAKTIPAVTAKTYKGRKVLTLKDLYSITGVQTGTFSYYIRRSKGYFVEGADYWLLDGAELVKFKADNGMSSSMAKSLTLITSSGLEKLSKMMHGIPDDTMKLIGKSGNATPEPEYNLPKEDNDVRRLIDATLKEIGAMERLVKQLNLFNTREELEKIKSALQLFQVSAFQKVAALTLLEV